MGKEKNKIVIRIIISISTVLFIYFGLSNYLINHFYFGSTINGINVSGKTVDEVEEEMIYKVQWYKLELQERGGNKEQITASDIGLIYKLEGKIKELKDKQNFSPWIISLPYEREYKIEETVTYDEKLLDDRLNKLSCFDSNNIIEPQNPRFEYKDNEYVILDEVYGNKVNKNILYESVINAIIKEEKTIDFEASNCYENPQYNSNSQEVINTKDILNKYINSQITYTFGDNTEVLDGSIINKWLKINESLEITFDEKEIICYLNKLSDTYDTVGKSREFITSLGTTINIGGGDYGWIINKNEEIQNLIKTIKEGAKITREPIYVQAAQSRVNNDIGNTYIEINLKRQHLWFYKNGVLLVDGDVVTGNESNNHSTPTGIYKLKYKQKDATLKGADYSTHVNFWMPFNMGIGLHDASWRSTFGGNIYMTNGSHGCVNAPYNLAKTIFNNVQGGSPVICYYE